MSDQYSRREALKTLGLALGAALPLHALAVGENGERLHLPSEIRTKPSRTITAITLGAGNRGNVYGNYALAYTSELNIVGVAETISRLGKTFLNGQSLPTPSSSPHRMICTMVLA